MQKLKTKSKVIPFNPGSRTQIADRLIRRGWKPLEFTPSGQPKIDDAVLAGITDISEAALLAEYFMLQKRLGQLSDGKQSWLSKVKDGRLHGRIDTLGTGTFRCSHMDPNLAQVPSCAAPYGKECRSLFHAPEGYDIVGCDVAKLELMALGHYMNDPKFNEVLLGGDVHQLLADVYGVDRRTGKTVTYAFMYGAGLKKLGSIVEPSASEAHQIKAGKQIHANMQERLPSLAKLVSGVKKKAEMYKYLLAIDGRRLPVRSPHSALNFLCQSAGAIICKQWVVNFHQMLRERSYSDIHQVAFVHDELQILVPEGMGQEIGELCVQAITQAGEDLGLRLPIGGEFNVGKSWADTH